MVGIYSNFSKLKRISAEAEPAGTIRDSNSVESILNRIWKGIQRPRLEFTKESLHLRPKFFNRIQIRTIRWKIDVSNPRAVQQIFYCLCMVRLHIIHNPPNISEQRTAVCHHYSLFIVIYFLSQSAKSRARCGVCTGSCLISFTHCELLIVLRRFALPHQQAYPSNPNPYS